MAFRGRKGGNAAGATSGLEGRLLASTILLFGVVVASENEGRFRQTVVQGLGDLLDAARVERHHHRPAGRFVKSCARGVTFDHRHVVGVVEVADHETGSAFAIAAERVALLAVGIDPLQAAQVAVEVVDRDQQQVADEVGDFKGSSGRFVEDAQGVGLRVLALKVRM